MMIPSHGDLNVFFEIPNSNFLETGCSAESPAAHRDAAGLIDRFFLPGCVWTQENVARQPGFRNKTVVIAGAIGASLSAHCDSTDRSTGPEVGCVWSGGWPGWHWGSINAARRERVDLVAWSAKSESTDFPGCSPVLEVSLDDAVGRRCFPPASPLLPLSGWRRPRSSFWYVSISAK